MVVVGGPNINHRLSHAGLDTKWQMTVVWSKIQYHFQIFAALPYSIFVNLVGNLYWGIQKSGKVDRCGKLNSHSRTKDKLAKTCATFVHGCKLSWSQGKKAVQLYIISFGNNLQICWYEIPLWQDFVTVAAIRRSWNKKRQYHDCYHHCNENDEIQLESCPVMEEEREKWPGEPTTALHCLNCHPAAEGDDLGDHIDDNRCHDPT